MRRLPRKISTDTIYFPAKSLHGNVACQVYFDKCGFVVSYPIPAATDQYIAPTLKSFSEEYGIPEHLTMDGAAVQTGRKTEFMSYI